MTVETSNQAAETPSPGSLTDDAEAISLLVEALGGEDEPEPDSADDADDDAAPPDGAPSDEDQDDQREPPEGALIAPPASWSKEQAKVWPTLPAAAQSVIAERETARDAEVRARQNETAELRKAEQGRSQQMQQWGTWLEQLQQHAQQTFTDEFAGVDWQALSREDPAKYVDLSHRYNAKQAALQQMGAARQQLVERQGQEASAAAQARLVSEAKALSEAVPEFRDPGKRQAMQAEVVDYLKERGFSPEEMATIGDHRTMLVVLDAIKGRKLEAARSKTATRVAAAPQRAVLQPSAPATPGETGQRRIKDDMQALKGARSTEDQAKVLARYL